MEVILRQTFIERVSKSFVEWAVLSIMEIFLAIGREETYLAVAFPAFSERNLHFIELVLSDQSWSNGGAQIGNQRKPSRSSSGGSS